MLMEFRLQQFETCFIIPDPTSTTYLFTHIFVAQRERERERAGVDAIRPKKLTGNRPTDRQPDIVTLVSALPLDSLPSFLSTSFLPSFLPLDLFLVLLRHVLRCVLRRVLRRVLQLTFPHFFIKASWTNRPTDTLS